MDAPLIDQRVSCRKCQFCFAVQLSPIQGRWIESQCPACEVWACFTIADSPERQPSLPDSEELEERDRTIQRLGEQLWPPIKAYSNHPSVAWFDRIGNGVFADDHSRICWPASCWVYRFSRGGHGCVHLAGGRIMVRSRLASNSELSQIARTGRSLLLPGGTESAVRVTPKQSVVHAQP